MPNFKPSRAGYESVYYGINNMKSTLSEREHEMRNIVKFGVYGAYIERDTAIQKLQNLIRNI